MLRHSWEEDKKIDSIYNTFYNTILDRQDDRWIDRTTKVGSKNVLDNCITTKQNLENEMIANKTKYAMDPRIYYLMKTNT